MASKTFRLGGPASETRAGWNNLMFAFACCVAGYQAWLGPGGDSMGHDKMSYVVACYEKMIDFCALFWRLPEAKSEWPAWRQKLFGWGAQRRKLGRDGTILCSRSHVALPDIRRGWVQAGTLRVTTK